MKFVRTVWLVGAAGKDKQGRQRARLVREKNRIHHKALARTEEGGENFFCSFPK